MNAWELATAPDSDREAAVLQATSAVLTEALVLSRDHGFANAAAVIAYELGLRESREMSLQDLVAMLVKKRFTDRQIENLVDDAIGIARETEDMP